MSWEDEEAFYDQCLLDGVAVLARYTPLAGSPVDTPVIFTKERTMTDEGVRTYDIYAEGKRSVLGNAVPGETLAIPATNGTTYKIKEPPENNDLTIKQTIVNLSTD